MCYISNNMPIKHVKYLIKLNLHKEITNYFFKLVTHKTTKIYSQLYVFATRICCN